MNTISSQLSSSHVEAEQLKNYIGQVVKVHGMIYKIREMSGFAFVILKTKRVLLQCIYSEQYASFALSELQGNMSVVMTGEVLRDQRSRSGVELRLLTFEALSAPAQETPIVINNKEIATSIETLLDHRPITLRNAKERAIFQIQAGICRGFRKFFDENRFTEIHSPKIVFSGAEGGANIFKLDYFGKQAYLAQSPQFYKHIMLGVFERVYEIAPVFRAEKHDTARHINEYTSVDVEVGFIDSFRDIMKLETKMLGETLQFLREQYTGELSLLKADLPVITEIPAVTFSEAKELIAKTYKREITDFEDFEPEEEKQLCGIIKK